MSKCLRCGKNFKQSWRLKRHFKNEQLCELKLLDVSYKDMTDNYNDLLEVLNCLEKPNIDVAECSRNVADFDKNVADFRQNVADFSQNVADFSPNVAEKMHKNNKNTSILENSEKKFEKNFKKFVKNEKIRILNKKKLEKNISKSKNYECEKCKKRFKHHSSYYRHYNYRCKKDEQKTVINNIHNGDNIQNTIHNIQNIQNNIIINNFGEENTDYITDETLLKFINVPYNAIQKTSEEIHFNETHPENQNVKSTNKKEKYVEVFINRKWIIFEKKRIQEKMMNIAMFMLNDVYGREGNDKLSTAKRKKFERFQKDMIHNKEVQKFVKDGLEMLLLNEEVVTI